MKIEIYDATLREGAQKAGVVFSDYEKLKIISDLSSLGVAYIETGFFAPDSADALCKLCTKASGSCGDSVLSVLCQTRRPETRASEDPLLCTLAESGIPAVAVVGKASRSQANGVLGAGADENLNMVRDTVGFLKRAGKRVIFDAEHFFDGYTEDPDYAKAVAAAAGDAGADAVVLCDTNGGMLPDVISLATEAVKTALPGLKIGIHCHNDSGMADACAVSAVLSGASQVQCTVNGIGERCGNTSISTVIPVLQLKLGFSCIPDGCIKLLSQVTRSICHTANLGFDESEPFVGGHAFMHKAGLHIDAVRKEPSFFEHIDPELVGNRRSMIVSELSGRAAITGVLEQSGYSFGKDAPEIGKVLSALRLAEADGRLFDSAGASLRLLIERAIGDRTPPFEVRDYKLIFSAEAPAEIRWSAIVKIFDGNQEQLRVGEGDGPVNALDVAAHLALRHRYPEIDRVKMVDIKARIDSNDSAASASLVRVSLESGDGEKVWRTMGASTDIIAASWQSLLDSYEYYILSERGLLPQSR